MEKQTIDTYKLTSLEEPSEEILSQLMREVAEEAKRKGMKQIDPFLIAWLLKASWRCWNGIGEM